MVIVMLCSQLKKEGGEVFLAKFVFHEQGLPNTFNFGRIRILLLYQASYIGKNVNVFPELFKLLSYYY
jgi:hypothetical protein